MIRHRNFDVRGTEWREHTIVKFELGTRWRLCVPCIVLLTVGFHFSLSGYALLCCSTQSCSLEDVKITTKKCCFIWISPYFFSAYVMLISCSISSVAVAVLYLSNKLSTIFLRDFYRYFIQNSETYLAYSSFSIVQETVLISWKNTWNLKSKECVARKRNHLPTYDERYDVTLHERHKEKSQPPVQ